MGDVARTGVAFGRFWPAVSLHRRSVSAIEALSVLPQTIQKHCVSVLGATKTRHRRCVSATGALWDCLGAAKTLHWRSVSHTGALTSVVFRPQGAQKHRVFAFAPRTLTKCFKVALLGLLLVHFWPKASKTLENRPPGVTFGTCYGWARERQNVGSKYAQKRKKC